MTASPCGLSPGRKWHKPPAPHKTGEETIQPEEDVKAIEEQDDIRPIMQTPAMCLPANSSKCWTVLEESLINLDPLVKLDQAYKLYACSRRDYIIPARTLKIMRMSKK